MVVYALKPRFRQALRPILRVVGKLHPNAISALAVLLAAAAGGAFLLAPSRPSLLLLIPPLLFLRIACNALDGMVAQERGLASRRGELVNEASDRLNDALILGGLGASGLVDVRWAALALAIALLVSYLGILPKSAGGTRRYEGPLGKADRMLLLGLGSVAAWAVPRWGWGSTTQILDATLLLFVPLGLLTLAVRWTKAWKELEARP